MGAWRTPREGRRAATLLILTQFRVLVKTSIEEESAASENVLPENPPPRTSVGKRGYLPSELGVETARAPFAARLREALHRLGKHRGPVVFAVLASRHAGVHSESHDVAIGRRGVGMFLERGSETIGLPHGDRPVGFRDDQAELAIANAGNGVHSPRLRPDDGDEFPQNAAETALAIFTAKHLEGLDFEGHDGEIVVVA